MPRQTVTITEPNSQWLQERVESGEFTTQTDALNDALRRARELESGVQSIRQALIEGEESGMSNRTVDEIWAEARKRRKTDAHA